MNDDQKPWCGPLMVLILAAGGAVFSLILIFALEVARWTP
jgi:hypothetical protein